MRSWRLLLGVLGATIMFLGAGAADIQLPAGPDRDLVSRECQACHDLQNVIDSTGSSREGWDGAIEEMVGYGLSVTPEDRAKILDYLSTYLGPASKPATPGR
jgi:Quinohemoprotein amine dehydrogenase A, alpha subunit, haem binding